MRDRLLSTLTEEMAVYSVFKAELFYGAMQSNNPKTTLDVGCAALPAHPTRWAIALLLLIDRMSSTHQ